MSLQLPCLLKRAPPPTHPPTCPQMFRSRPRKVAPLQDRLAGAAVALAEAGPAHHEGSESEEEAPEAAPLELDAHPAPEVRARGTATRARQPRCVAPCAFGLPPHHSPAWWASLYRPSVPCPPGGQRGGQRGHGAGRGLAPAHAAAPAGDAARRRRSSGSSSSSSRRRLGSGARAARAGRLAGSAAAGAEQAAAALGAGAGGAGGGGAWGAAGGAARLERGLLDLWTLKLMRYDSSRCVKSKCNIHGGLAWPIRGKQPLEG